MNRDTDGYIIIDLKGIDVSRASQSVPGFYEKVEPVLDANKLVIVNNAGNHTPLPGSCIKSSNYIKITTDIYIFTINSNNILIIEANGSSITVDVSIIPAYSEGTKIADFEINGQSGELYIPAYPDIINDSVASDHTVYSSDKVNTLLSGKADTSAIPTKTSDLDNDSGYITSSDIPAIPDDLNDLSDVDISSVSDAQVLTYDAISGKWVNATSQSGVTALSQLSDVTIASASDGEVLTYDSASGKWVNADVPTYTEGTGIDITSNTVSLDINGLTSASTLNGTEEIAIYDGTGEKKTTAAAVANTLNNYTSNETLMGSWFGVRDIYRKYIDIGNLPNNATKQTMFFDGKIRDLIDLRVIACTTSLDSFISIPYLSSQAAFNIECDVEVSNNKSYLNVTTHTDRTGLVGFAIIEYTKQT